MSKLNVSVMVDAAPEKVFAAASDFPRGPEMIEGIESIEMLTDGPVGVGTKFRETRVMFGKSATEEMEVTDFQPGKAYTLEAFSCGCHYASVVSCTPEGSGTRLSIDMVGTPKTLSAKLMSPIGMVMSGSMSKAMTKDLEDIKRAVEAGA